MMNGKAGLESKLRDEVHQNLVTKLVEEVVQVGAGFRDGGKPEVMMTLEMVIMGVMVQVVKPTHDKQVIATLANSLDKHMPQLREHLSKFNQSADAD